MTATFDVFRTETGGTILWITSAATLEDAKTYVQELAMCSPGEYVLLDQKTGKRVAIKVDGGDGTQVIDRTSAKEGDTH